MLSVLLMCSHPHDLRSQIKDDIQADLCNRTPGKAMSIDSTFSIAKHINGEAGCMAYICGEYGHIVSFGALATESFRGLLPLLYQ